MPTILTKKSDTPGAVPSGTDLTNLAGGAEVAVNTADKRMFTMNSSSAIIELGTNPGSLTTAEASATVFRSGSATITNLIATTGTISDLSATVARVDSGTVTTLVATSGTITTLGSTSANITTLTGTTFGTTGTTQLRGASGQITTLTATSSNITTLTGTSATITNILDGAGNVRDIPSAGAAKTSAYTLSVSDVGEYVTIGSGGGIVVPDGIFSAGNAISVVNNTTGDAAISLTITTAYLAGTDADKAVLTLATRGIATVLFLSNSACIVSGNVS